MSGLEHLSPLLCLKVDREKIQNQSTLPLKDHHHNKTEQYGTRPLGPVQPSEPPVCLWVQWRDQRVLGEGAGCAVGAGVGDEALDHHPYWVTLEGPWETAGHLQQMS